MKRNLLTIVVIVFDLFVMPLRVFAVWCSNTFIVDGVKYCISYRGDYYDNYIPGSDATVSVVANDYSGDITIPDSITVTLTKWSMRAGGDYVSEDFDYTFKVTNIASGAFKDCVGLESVTIPASIRTIGASTQGDYYYEISYTNPFSGCTSLNSIVVDKNNNRYDSRDNCNAIIETSANRLLVVSKQTIIPNSVTSIGRYAYADYSTISSISVPNGIKSIDDYAFSGCTKLSTVSLPDGLKSVGQYAFQNCTSLTSIEIPNGVSNIGGWAFEGCSKLTSLTFSDGLTSFDAHYFDGCSSFSDLYCYATNPTKLYYEWFDMEKGAVVPEPAVVAFMDKTTLHVHDYAYEAFLNDTIWNKFKAIVYDRITDYNLTFYIDNIEYKNIQYKIDDITSSIEEPTREGYTFSGWSEIPATMPGKDVRVYGTFLPNNVTVGNVVYHVFNDEAKIVGCNNLSGALNIADSVKFDSITSPVKAIPNNIFKNKTEITSLVVPDGITTIGDNAFNGCTKLEKIELPSTIATIGERAFAGIDKLTEVTVGAFEVPTTDRTAFENSYIEDYVTLYVPGSAIKKYKEAAPWKNFKEIKAIPSTEVIERHKLIYMVDGDRYDAYDYAEGDSITPIAAPTKEGYTFSGWSEIPDVMQSEDITVTGTFTINKYKLTYKVDGAEYKSLEVEYGTAITAESAPTKTGYTFSGWDNVPEKMPANDVTISGTFTINKYKLVYKVDGEDYKSYDVEYGASITAEAAPTKGGYVFSGWGEIPATMPANDVTVSGTFSKGSYKIIYKVDGEEYKTAAYDFGDTITPEAEPTRTGYTFSGWSEIPSTMPAEDLTVTGTFTINKYKLTYMVDGEEYKTVEVEYNAPITAEAEPEKDGYEFSGWSEAPSNMPAEDVIISGTFIKKEEPKEEPTPDDPKEEDPDPQPQPQTDTEKDGVTYQTDGENATVMGGANFVGTLTIEETIEISGVTYKVTTIAEGAFKGCIGITSLQLPNTITMIGAGAFEGCSSLQMINLGTGIREIASRAFANIFTKARTRAEETGFDFYCETEDMPTAAADAFDGADLSNATLHVTDALVDAYKITSPWSRFGTIKGQTETGIMPVGAAPTEARIYDLSGNRRDQLRNGVNIIRMKDGKTYKMNIK